MAGPFSGQNPSYEFIYIFEQNRRGYEMIIEDKSHLYWIDEEPVDSSADSPNWQLEKQLGINQNLEQYRDLPPNWEIERHWKLGTTHIYRLHLRKKQNQ